MSENVQTEDLTRESPTWRGVTMTRESLSRFVATNERGASITISSNDEDAEFTPVELMLAALASCSAVTVDALTSRRAEPTTFEVAAEGHKVKDEHGSHLVQLRIDFDLRFPDGEAGDKAREMIPRALQQTHERLCTVSKTVELGEPVVFNVVEPTR